MLSEVSTMRSDIFLSKRQLEDLLKLARLAAESAAIYIGRDRSGDRRVQRELRRDTKVAADMKLESIIVKKLQSSSGYPILSEECGLIKAEGDAANFRWIVDPLDGSVNFSRSIPISCISIALWQDMKPLLGVVLDFNRKEIFTGLAGKGAWLNGIRIKTSSVADKSRAILCTGFPAAADYSVNSLRVFAERIKRYKKVRLFGSAALSLAYVASGRADMYREDDISIWDVAAGLALVKAAGGFISITPSRKNTGVYRVIAAGNRYLMPGKIRS